MSETTSKQRYEQRKALANELIQALGDDVLKRSVVWWRYFFTGVELGPDRARQLVERVHAVEAQGGMNTVDGSRKRTLGGIFFVLAKEQLTRRQTLSIHKRADLYAGEVAARAAQEKAPRDTHGEP